MAVPEYVPRPPDEVARVYGSPPWRPDPWMAVRPSDIRTRQPIGDRLGRPGPDQGYALRLVRQFDDRLVLAEGEDRDDVVHGCLGVALKRASMLGRAPVIHDWTVAFTVWGYLGEAPADLVELRRPLFEEVANPHHYDEARLIADLVPESTLRLSPDEVRQQASRDWRSLLSTLDEVRPAPVVTSAPAPTSASSTVEASSAVDDPPAAPAPAPAAEAERTAPPEPAAPAPAEPESRSAPEPAAPEPLPPWRPPERPAAETPPAEPALRPAAKAPAPTPPPATTPARPAAKKKVVKKKVVKKVVKKKVAKKPVEGEGSVFSRPPEGGGEGSPSNEGPRTRARDLGKDK